MVWALATAGDDSNTDVQEKHPDGNPSFARRKVHILMRSIPAVYRARHGQRLGPTSAVAVSVTVVPSERSTDDII
jgi:hypothetical protein